MSRPVPATGIPHGTSGGYCNYRCRCDPCRAAWAACFARWRAKQTPANAPEHGTANAYYNYRCRCAPCRAVRAALHQASKAGAS